MDQNIMKIADLSPEDVDNINNIQSQIKTRDNKEIILIAYEKNA
ncbi:MAG: hypothetical protein ACOX5F_09995 [Anaerovoracaceae bacterium]|jgi:hypothetical protein